MSVEFYQTLFASLQWSYKFLLEMILWYSSFILSMQKYVNFHMLYHPGISGIKLSILYMLPLLIFSSGFFLFFSMSEIYLYFFLSSNILEWIRILEFLLTSSNISFFVVGRLCCPGKMNQGGFSFYSVLWKNLSVIESLYSLN